MSTKYPGGLITKNPVTPAGPYENGAAPGVWTVEQALQYTKQGIWPIAGNQDPANIYIEYLFQTYLYTGNGSTQTITNGIDLSGKGGMVWLKDRSSGQSHALSDTVRGTGTSKQLQSNTTSAATTDTLTGFTSSGFTLDASFGLGAQNLNTVTYASWTFRKQAKFFDVVTYTGNGAAQTLSHNLGSVPGCIIVKNITSAQQWNVYHRSLNGGTNPEQYYAVLNTTAASAFGSNQWNSTAPTSTQFTVGSVNSSSGDTYVAYVFAHNAGGFGLTGTDNVISCGSFTTDGSGNATVSLGYEPQWVLMKPATTSTSGNWIIADNMRGWTVDGAGGNANQQLYANSSSAESGGTPANLTSTGFNFTSSYGPWASQTWIYIAIRRGPMAVPTSGTSVFTPIARTGTSSPTTVTGVGFPPDLVIGSGRSNATGKTPFDRLRGATYYLDTTATSAEASDATSLTSFAVMDGYGVGADGGSVNTVNFAIPLVSWNFRRAPSFFDEVCYTGTNTTGPSIPHNLGVAPELMIVKNRTTATTNWWIYSASLGNTSRLIFTNAAVGTGTTVWNSTSPTSSVFTVGTPAGNTNGSTSETFVAYLFATCAGVSKVGSYTGTGATQTISCGFTGGARFVLIKRTDSTGDWCVWDTARGMVSGTDPRLFFNSTSVEYNNDWVYTTTGGFQIVTTDANVNASGGTYIYLAIA